MKNKKLNLVLIMVLMLFVTACGSKGIVNPSNNNQNTNNKVFDAPYFGDITVGSITFNMLSTDDQIEEKGMEHGWLDIRTYEDEETDSKMIYDFRDFDDSYEIDFRTHNSLYQDLGCEDCDNAMSVYVKLPKNITYDSTMDDVMAAYGKPTPYDSDDMDGYNPEEHGYKDFDESYEYEDNSLTGETFGEIECYKLHYFVKNSNTTRFTLYLYFTKDTKKLYRVEYLAEVDK